MKQTSIEWLKKELEDYGSPSHLNLDWSTFDELIEQAKEMHKQEMTTNCSQQEISDEEIEDIAWEKFITDSGRFGFISGAKWYREQLKQRQ
jgi:hypothetical protein